MLAARALKRPNLEASWLKARALRETFQTYRYRTRGREESREMTQPKREVPMRQGGAAPTSLVPSTAPVLHGKSPRWN